MSGAAAYPERNPFPNLGTFTITGERGESGSRTTAYLPRQPILRLAGEIESYLNEFLPAWNKEGRVVMVRGPHGSGKTHSIYAALRQCTGASGIFPIYILQQDDNFFECYRQVVARLNKEPGLLKRLSGTLLASMAAEQWKEDLGSAPSGAAAAEPIQVNAAQAERLFATYTVGRSAATSRQEKALLDLTQSAFNKSLKQAVDALQGGKFDQAAIRWFLLEPVTPDELAAMGIAGPISNSDEAVAAILLLAALLTNAGCKLVFVIDQIEKLLLRTEALVARRNEGYLRTLIEGFRLRNGLLVLSGSDDGWESLPEDVRGRIGARVVDCPLLTLEEASDLLRLYLTPSDAPFTPGSGSLYPFTETAVREMLALAAGNPRKLMQFSHEAFRRAQPSQARIDDSDIRQLAKDDPRHYFNRDSALAETRRVLTFQPLRFQENYKLNNNMPFDFGLLYADGTPALLINVIDAIFQDDEAANAYVAAGMVASLRKSGTQVPLVMVATGYVSPDVVEHLSKVVHKLIVYAPDTYEKELRKVVELVAKHAASVAAPAPATSDLEDKVERLLRQLAEQRANQTAMIENRGSELAETQAAHRYEERLDKARQDWGSQRRDLEGKIQTARKMRRQEALKQVNDQIALARWIWWVRDLALVATGVVLISLSNNPGTSSVPSWPVTVAIYLIAFAVIDSAIALTEPRAWRSRTGARDLNSLGRGKIARIAWWVHGTNPIFRLASYRGNRSREIPQESRGLIREAALQHVNWKQIESPGLPAIPESLLAIESRVGVSYYSAPGEIAEAAKILSALRGGMVPDSFLTELAAGAGHHGGVSAEAFNVGLDRVPLQSLPFVGERKLREAIRVLSPLEEGGLGTYDFLGSIPVIDEMFLFCSQYLFYTERDVLRKP